MDVMDTGGERDDLAAAGRDHEVMPRIGQEFVAEGVDDRPVEHLRRDPREDRAVAGPEQPDLDLFHSRRR